jgi:hypothetical protein
MEFMENHFWLICGLALFFVVFLYVACRYVLKLWPRSPRLFSIEGMYYDERATERSRRSSAPSGSYLPAGGAAKRSSRFQDGEARDDGQGMTLNPHDLRAPKDSEGRGSDLQARLGHGNQSERPASGSPSAAETLRPPASSKWTFAQTIGRLEDRITRAEHQLADIDRMVIQILEIVSRGTDKGPTPRPEPVSRAPQPTVRRTTTLDDIVLFWNEGADWGDPDASIRDFGQQILRDGWRILGPVKTLHRVVVRSDNSSRLFLFPSLKRATKYYDRDFFLMPGSGDRKELVRPAEIQLLDRAANLDHEIVRLGGGETRLSDVFEVVEKGEII